MKLNHNFLVLGVLSFLLPSVAYANASSGLSSWLYNIATQVPSLIKLVVVVSYISGFGFLISSVMKFKACAQASTMMSSQQGVGGPVIYLLVGVVLLYFAGFVKVGSVTLLGEGSTIAYQDSMAGGFLHTSTITSIFIILKLIGYIAFIKGIYILARLGGSQAQPGTLGKGMVHILGGILAINIEATYVILLNTLMGSSVIG